MPKVVCPLSVRPFLAMSAAMLVALLPLTGCGPMASKVASTSAASSGTNNTAGGYTPGAIGGIVHGGQQPIIGASVQLYQVGTGGPGSAATPLLSSPVLTDASGNFNITGQYSCSSSSSLVYLVGTGGNPGSGITNSSIVMIGALGQCGSIGASTRVVLNELTTAAAAFGLSNYMDSATNVGYSSSDLSGILSAFSTAQGYASLSTGTSSNSTITAVANVMAACVNGSSATCGTIASATGGGSNILASMLYMSRTSLSEFTDLFTKYVSPNSPFPTGTGAGSSSPTSSCPNTSPIMSPLPSFTVKTVGGVSTATITGMAGATFYHTTDGSTPNGSSATTTSFTVQLNDVIEVLATKSCYSDLSYDAPTNTPTVVDNQGSVTVTPLTTGTSYFYTLNGNLPTTLDTPYTSGLVLTTGAQDSVTVLAKAPGLKPAYSSLVSTLPLIQINGTTVTLTDQTNTATDGAAQLSYGLNGTNSTLLPYTGGFTVALADIAYGCAKTSGRAMQCSMLPGSGGVTPTVDTNGNATFTKDMTEAQVFYTRNGASPDISSSQYSGTAISLAIADVLGYGAKAPGRPWTLNVLPAVTPPTVSITNGVATMTDSFANASIFYTTDGTQPTVNSYRYAPPSFQPALMDVLSARAKAPGYQYSPWYATMVPAATGTPYFSYSKTTGLVTMTVGGDTAAKVFYTTDQSAPGLSSKPYTAPFTPNIADIYLMIAKSPGRPTGYASSVVTTPSMSTQGTWSAGGILTFTDSGNDGRQFFYVTNPYNGYGSPTVYSAHYAAPFRVNPYTWVTAIAKIPGYAPSSPWLDGIMGDVETLGSCGVVANGLAADRVGNVYAACADSTTTENVYQFGPSGAKSAALFSFSLTNASSTPLGITVTPGGTLYVPDPNAGGVHRYMNGVHTFVTTPGLHPDHVFTQDWEQVLVLDGTGNYQLINPGTTTATAITDGHAPTTCTAGLLDNPYSGGVYCATTTAYLGSSYIVDGSTHAVFTDKTAISVPGVVGGLTLAVNGDMYLTTRSSSTVNDSSLWTIHPRVSASSTAASPLLLTNGRTVTTTIDGTALTSLTLNNPMAVTSDPTGNIYVGEGTGSIRRLREAQYIAAASLPSVSYSGGSFQVSSATSGATLYYTVDGSIPTKGAWAFLSDFGQSAVTAANTPANTLNTVGSTMKVPASGSISAPSGTTINVIAVADGMFDSGVATATAP